eukprot:3042098-Amphidinium_carterae.1
MAIARQSKYLSTGEPWRQNGSSASGGPVKGAKSSTMWSWSNHDFPGTQWSLIVRSSWTCLLYTSDAADDTPC